MIRFAIIGCGRIVKNHLAAIEAHPRAELVACCDLRPDLARNYCRQSYADYGHMLREHQVEVVVLATPSGFHPFQALEIMKEFGRHLIVEKPLALKLQDALEVFDTASNLGLKVFPVYQNRYNPAVQAVKDELAGGRLGRPVLATVRVRWCRPQRYYERDLWRGSWALDGGALTNQGIHFLDLLSYLVGPVDRVQARVATQLVQVEVEDTAVATLSFENGALGLVEVTTAARPDDQEAAISVLCENGTARLDGLACNRLTIELEGETIRVEEEIPDAYGHGHTPFYADVIEDLEGGTCHPIDREQALTPLRFLNAIYRSAEDSREVALEEGLSSRRLGTRDLDLEQRYLAARRA